jgi:1-acyl-sn-glycerol-3-phosphate acyltransferase
MIRTIFLTAYLTLLTLFVGIPLVLYAALSGSAELLNRTGVNGVRRVMRWVGVRVRIEGLENIPPGTCVFAANHTSNADGPAIVGAVPRRVAILAKKSLFAIPVVGTAFRLAHYVPVDRGNLESAMASVDLAAEYVKQGTSFLIYPEGTRSRDGRLGQFKRGSFLLAIKAGAPVVPVACIGAHRILPKKSLRIRRGEIVVRFCPAIETTGCTVEQRGQLAKSVHAAIAAALPPDQQPRA